MIDMGRGINKNMDLLSHFMAPLGTKFSVFICGDNVGFEYENEIKKSFNQIKQWEIKDFDEGGLIHEDISYIRLSTTEIFRGALDSVANFDNDIMCLDSELSRKILYRIVDEYCESDDIENMLINKYIINSGCDKYIFDLSKLNRKVLSSVFRVMDYNLDGFNYVVSGDSMGLCAVGLTEYIGI